MMRDHDLHDQTKKNIACFCQWLFFVHWGEKNRSRIFSPPILNFGGLKSGGKKKNAVPLRLLRWEKMARFLVCVPTTFHDRVVREIRVVEKRPVPHWEK